jgi:hypothetical protein
MKWIAETNKPRDHAAGVEFVCNEARDASAERFATYQQFLIWAFAMGHRSDRINVFGYQGFCARRRPFGAASAPRSHVFEFKAGHGNPMTGNQLCHAFEKG